jgi:hypothetical protein
LHGHGQTPQDDGEVGVGRRGIDRQRTGRKCTGVVAGLMAGRSALGDRDLEPVPANATAGPQLQLDVVAVRTRQGEADDGDPRGRDGGSGRRGDPGKGDHREGKGEQTTHGGSSLRGRNVDGDRGRKVQGELRRTFRVVRPSTVRELRREGWG